jgi:hypothetical protein
LNTKNGAQVITALDAAQLAVEDELAFSEAKPDSLSEIL